MEGLFSTGSTPSSYNTYIYCIGHNNVVAKEEGAVKDISVEEDEGIAAPLKIFYSLLEGGDS